MNPQQERRWAKLRIALLSIPFLISGSMLLAPAIVVRPVLDSKGLQVFREDGSRMMKMDHWGNFKINWIGFTLIYTGIGVLIVGLGGWLHEGISGGKEPKTISKEP